MVEKTEGKVGRVGFLEVMGPLNTLQDRKGKDYGKPEEPLANLMDGKEWGIPGWQSSVMRVGDKMKRFQAFARNGSMANESLLDCLCDSLVYFNHALRLYIKQEGMTIDDLDNAINKQG